MSGERITRQVYQEWYETEETHSGWDTDGWRFSAKHDGLDGHLVDNNDWAIIEETYHDKHSRAVQGIARRRNHTIMPGELFEMENPFGDEASTLYPLDASNPFPLDASNPFPLTTTGPLLFNPPSTTVPERDFPFHDSADTPEVIHYQKLTKFQKDVVDALLTLGFKWKYGDVYECSGWSDVHVSKFSSWSQVINRIHEDGKDQKRFEIARVLGIT